MLQLILYAGLGGTLLALIVATAQNKWSARVFFLLALRLAIGWHFLFEGLHKIHSHEVGPTETNRPFSSEIYFKVAPGPLGAQMRKQFDDPEVVIASFVKPTQEYASGEFAKLPLDQQAQACPEAVAKELDALAALTEEAITTRAAAELKAADEAEKKSTKAAEEAEKKGAETAKTDDEKAKLKTNLAADKDKAKKDAETDRQDARKRIEGAKEAAPKSIAAAKAKYARWVYGVDRRPTKVKFVTGDVSLSGPERLAHLAMLRDEAKTAQERISAGLGNGYGIDSKKAAEVRTDLIAAESDLAKDALAFVTELKADLSGGKATDEPAPPSLGKRMDKVTMWFLVVVGGSLMAGLFTRAMCVLGAGFLAMTYLAHPAFPWFPLPPNTEGNPVFINKNVIEGLALLALASLPTGKWLGIDALISRCCGCGGSDTPTA